jgi:hypothetical protein
VATRKRGDVFKAIENVNGFMKEAKEIPWCCELHRPGLFPQQTPSSSCIIMRRKKVRMNKVRKKKKGKAMSPHANLHVKCGLGHHIKGRGIGPRRELHPIAVVSRV